LLHCDKKGAGRPRNRPRRAAGRNRPKALPKGGLFRSNLNSFGYLVVAASKNAAHPTRFQDNIIRKTTPCPSLA
jgi:hypothetical protein